MAKKMELTRENINALLGPGSFKEKTSSTFSRGSTQTSGGRGPGKGKKELIHLRSSPAVQEAHQSHLCHSLSLIAFQCCSVIKYLFPERLVIIVLKPAEGEIIKQNQSWRREWDRGDLLPRETLHALKLKCGHERSANSLVAKTKCHLKRCF